MNVKLFLLQLTLFSCCMIAMLNLHAQQSYDANYNKISFLAGSKIHKTGTDGSGAGNITLYANVITISGQSIDCIVKTVSLTGGTFTLPNGAAGGTIPFDYSANTGTGIPTDNKDDFFSPTFSWSSGGGSCQFDFQFILGGSYNNTTNTGTPVILQNVYLNTYDIDGNGGSNSNQYAEFGGFSSTQYATGGNIGTSYNTNTGLTKFRSKSTTNFSNVNDDATRIRVYYTTISKFSILLGADGSGAAYYFLDFSVGPNWTTTPSPISAL